MTESSDNGDSPAEHPGSVSSINTWLTGALYHTMRLTLMAVAGYAYARDQRAKGTTQLKDSKNNSRESVLCDFPLPHEESSSYATVKTIQKVEFIVCNSINLSSHQSSNSVTDTIRVVCVEFVAIDDVETLWLETVKLFSDLAGSRPIEISKNATYCMKVIITSIILIICMFYAV
jgi:hypothetical protein